MHLIWKLVTQYQQICLHIDEEENPTTYPTETFQSFLSLNRDDILKSIR